MKSLDLDRYLGFFDPPAPALIGLDVTASSVKLVELSQRRGGALALEGYAVEPLPKGLIADGAIVPERQEALAEAIARALKRLGSKTRRVAMAIPTSMVISKRLRFANTIPDEELLDPVRDQASSFIPFSLDEVRIDWRILGPSPAAPEEENEVLVCAAKLERAEDRSAVAEKAGLRVDVMDVEGYATQRAFELFARQRDLEDKVCALVDAGGTTTSFYFFHRGELLFTKEIPFGSSHLADALGSVYSLSAEEAERAIRSGGSELEGYEENALRPFLESFAMEVNRVAQFFLTQANADAVERIVLCGGCATFAGAAEAIAERSGIEAMLADPFAGMEIPSKLRRSIAADAPLLLSACGLALRRFDFS